MRSAIQRWRKRGGRTLRLALPFDAVAEIALALIGLSQTELEEPDWSVADRKRLLDNFLQAGKSVHEPDRTELSDIDLELNLPLWDAPRLRTFVYRDMPKAASNAA